MTTPPGNPPVLRRLDCPPAKYETKLFSHLPSISRTIYYQIYLSLKFNLTEEFAVNVENYNFYDAYPKQGTYHNLDKKRALILI